MLVGDRAAHAGGRSPFSLTDLHHRLPQIGHSHRRVVLLIYLWVGIVALGAASTIFVDPRYIAPSCGATVIGVVNSDPAASPRGRDFEKATASDFPLTGRSR